MKNSYSEYLGFYYHFQAHEYYHIERSQLLVSDHAEFKDKYQELTTWNKSFFKFSLEI